MVKKKINIKRADGIIQGYHVNTDGKAAPETVILPSVSQNPYNTESRNPMTDLDKNEKSFTNSKEKYSLMIDTVKNNYPEVYEQYLNVENGGSVTSDGLDRISKAVEDINTVDVNEKLLDDNVGKMLGMFGRSESDPLHRKMAKTLMTINAHSAQLSRDLNNKAITKEVYDEKISIIIVASNIVNASLMSKDPWV